MDHTPGSRRLIVGEWRWFDKPPEDAGTQDICNSSCRLRTCMGMPCHHTCKAMAVRFEVDVDLWICLAASHLVSGPGCTVSTESWRKRAQAPSSHSGMSSSGAVLLPPHFFAFVMGDFRMLRRVFPARATTGSGGAARAPPSLPPTGCGNSAPAVSPPGQESSARNAHHQ